MGARLNFDAASSTGAAQRVECWSHQSSVPTMESADLPAYARVLRRGLRVLRALRAAGPHGLEAATIAQAVRMQRAAVCRLLDVLVEEGYARRDSGAQRYRMADYASLEQVDGHSKTVVRLRPALRRISDMTGDTCVLVVRAGPDSLCIHRQIGHYPVQVASLAVGHRQPLGVGAAGLALLSALPAAEAQCVIEQNQRVLPDYGGMTQQALSQLVGETRERGFAVVGNAAVPGALGVGLALCDADGYPTASASVSSATDRMPPERQRMIADRLREQLAHAMDDARPLQAKVVKGSCVRS
jgi:DNA-binding IclR family transcriptional regulator